ncbi:MAG: hypothetical protein AVDCRST_MAG50-51, partial [uncultured Acidimicrobiales bacterium]
CSSRPSSSARWRRPSRRSHRTPASGRRVTASTWWASARRAT